MKTSAEGVAWDLSDLYAGLDDPKIEQDLTEAQKRAEKFEKSYRGKIAAEGGAFSGDVKDGQFLVRKVPEEVRTRPVV